MKTTTLLPAAPPENEAPAAHRHTLAYALEGGACYCDCGQFLGPGVTGRLRPKPITITLKLPARASSRLNRAISEVGRQPTIC
jgi:hypothetical protein